MAAIDTLRRNLNFAINNLAESGRNAFMAKHPNSTGQTAKTIKGEIVEVTLKSFEAQIVASKVAMIRDAGVPRASIPFSPTPPRRGGTSKYIQGLIKFAGRVKPGLSSAEQKSFAFSIAYKHLRTGIKGTNWIKAGLDNSKARAKFFKDLNLQEFASEQIKEDLKKLSNGRTIRTNF